MSKRRKPTLADYVEAAERRNAPRAQARATRDGAWWSAWVAVFVLTVVIGAGAVAFLRHSGVL